MAPRQETAGERDRQFVRGDRMTCFRISSRLPCYVRFGAASARSNSRAVRGYGGGCRRGSRSGKDDEEGKAERYGKDCVRCDMQCVEADASKGATYYCDLASSCFFLDGGAGFEADPE